MKPLLVISRDPNKKGQLFATFWYGRGPNLLPEQQFPSFPPVRLRESKELSKEEFKSLSETEREELLEELKEEARFEVQRRKIALSMIRNL